MFDYKLLEAFAAVINEGGFEKASKILNITQSAVSQRVKQLEDFYGSVLIIRGNPIAPTESGVRLLKHYSQVKLLEHGIFSELEEHRDHFRTIKIGLNADSLSTWVIPALSDFCKDKKILLDLLVDDQDVTHQFLKDGLVMGCISAYDKRLQGCRVDYLGSVKYILLCSPEYKNTWFKDGFNLESVSKAPSLIFSRKDNLQHYMIEKLLGKVPDGFSGHYIPIPESFNMAVLNGLGYGMIPEQFYEGYLDSGELVRAADSAEVDIKLYWHRWDIDSKLLNSFTAELLKQTKKLLKR